jgi:hypothetical protein
VPDRTSDGRYRLLELISRGAMAETWRAFDTVTQRRVAVAVRPGDDAGHPVIEELYRLDDDDDAARDGGRTVPKALPQPDAGSTATVGGAAAAPQADFVYEYPAYWPGMASTAEPTPDGQATRDDSKAPGPKTSGKRRLIVLSSLGAIAVVAAVVAGFVLIGPDQHGGGSQTSSTSASPAPPANTGPFTGTFAVRVTAATLSSGAPDTDPGMAAYTDTWNLRSACSANGCVATASAGNFEVSDLVFDNVGGRWFGVAISHTDCGRPNDEAWNAVSLAPQPDGTLTGEVTRATANGCFTRRTVTLTRTGDTDIAKLPDPTHLDPRAVSPAEALHGSYDDQTTYASGLKTVVNYGVRTDCLRAGDRCMSMFIAAKVKAAFVFANGVWTLNQDYTSGCSSGAKAHANFTETMALPQPPQNPITSLSAHGYENVTQVPGATCNSQTYDETYTRTGD